MTYTICESSPQAIAKIKSHEDAVGVSTNEHRLTKYPFDELHIGKSFTIPIDKANEFSLRINASNRGKLTGKKFTVIKHACYGIIEVARIA